MEHEGGHRRTPHIGDAVDLPTTIQLIESFKDINMKYNGLHETLLHIAVRQRHMPIIKHLVESGADINALDINKATPLHNASNRHEPTTTEHDILIIKYLLDNGAKIDAKDGPGHTPLNNAISWSNLIIVQYLVNSGANIHLGDLFGCEPLYLAAVVKNIEIVKFLLSNGANKEAKCARGETASERARSQGDHDIANYIDAYEHVMTKGVHVG